MSLLGQILNRAPVDLTGRGRLGRYSDTTSPRAGSSAALSAMGAQSTLFAIVDRIAQDVGAVEWRLYRRRAGQPAAPHRVVPTDENARVQVHPALTVWNNPNPYTTRQEFVEATAQHFDLVGEMPWIIGRAPAAPNGPPIELWNVRPDRIKPIPSPTDFTAGWLYTPSGSDFDAVPLRTDQVLFTKRPNPTNPYRGIGPVGTLLMDLEGEAAASAFNTAFFRNGAEPGGVLIAKEPLDDDEFNVLVERWNMQHRGVSNAHRVAVIEGDLEWQERRFSARDMQFEQLRRFSRETFRQAFGFPKPLLGDVEDVNRANAEAADVVFAKHILRPRLDRIRGTLNQDFLPLFGPLGNTVEFDYVDPVPPDMAELRLEVRNKVDTALSLIDARFDEAEVLEWAGLPNFTRAEPEPLVLGANESQEVGSDTDA